MTTMKTLAKKLPKMKDQTSYSKIAHLSTQNGQLDIIIDGLKVANCISRAPARSIIRHKDKIHFDVLFYSPSRHQNRNGRCIIIYFARLNHTQKKKNRTHRSRSLVKGQSDHQTSRINWTMLQNKSPGQFHGLIQFTTTFSRDIKCFSTKLSSIYMAGRFRPDETPLKLFQFAQ